MSSRSGCRSCWCEDTHGVWEFWSLRIAFFYGLETDDTTDEGIAYKHYGGRFCLPSLHGTSWHWRLSWRLAQGVHHNTITEALFGAGSIKTHLSTAFYSPVVRWTDSRAVIYRGPEFLPPDKLCFSDIDAGASAPTPTDRRPHAPLSFKKCLLFRQPITEATPNDAPDRP